MASDPLFIIGTERSGSNLLRVILNAHSHIAVPHPPHIMRYFAPLVDRYGDLERDSNLRSLVEDVQRLLRVHIYPWETPIDTDQVVAEASPRTLYGVTAAIYRQYLAWADKARWGCKSTFMVHHVDTVLATDPGARFLWLVRDPRDVASSSRKSVFSPFHPVHTARLWLRQQQDALALEARLPPETLMRLRYEDLLGSPEATLERVCAFLGEPFEPAMLQFSETDAARKGAGLSEDWAATARPIQRNNTGKYRQGLSASEILQVEAVTRPLMEPLGYLPDHTSPAPLDVGPLRELGWRTLDHAWNLQVEWRSLRTDRNHWRRWGRSLTLRSIDLRTRLMSRS